MKWRLSALTRGTVAGIIVFLGLGTLSCSGPKPTDPANAPEVTVLESEGSEGSEGEDQGGRAGPGFGFFERPFERRIVDTDSSLPDNIDPPFGATSFLEDPPGRAVLSASELKDWSEAEGFGDQATYFWGDDGGWRYLNLGDLGLSDSDWAGHDGSGSVVISPNGKWGAFSTASRLAILDMATAELVLRKLPGGVKPGGGQIWTSENTVLVSDEDRWSRRFEFDPSAGRLRAIETGGDPFAYLPDGGKVVYQQKGRDVTVVTTDGEGEVQRAEPRYVWNTAPGFYSGDRVLLPRTNWKTQLPVSQRPKAFLLVAHRQTHTPIEGMHLPEVKPPGYQHVFGWVDKESVLLQHDRALLIWKVDEGRLYRTTRIQPDLVVSVANDLVETRGR